MKHGASCQHLFRDGVFSDLTMVHLSSFSPQILLSDDVEEVVEEVSDKRAEDPDELIPDYYYVVQTNPD